MNFAFDHLDEWYSFQVNPKMKRRQHFVSPEQAIQSKKLPDLNWDKCMVCQEDAGELRCPLDSKSGNAKQSCESLAERILKYKSFEDLPASMNLDQLRDGRDLGQSLFDHGAKHHKKCYEMFSNGKIQRMEENSKKHSTVEDHHNDIVSSKARPATRSSTGANSVADDKTVCYFCQKSSDDENGKLHEVGSLRMDARVKDCARILEENFLQAKLSFGDMVNQEAKYHNNCLTDLYKRANTAQLDGSFTESERQLHGIAFSELVTYIEEMVTHSSDKKFVFKLSDLTKIYSQSLETLGITLQNRIHSTRLKNRILTHFPGMNCFPDREDDGF